MEVLALSDLRADHRDSPAYSFLLKTSASVVTALPPSSSQHSLPTEKQAKPPFSDRNVATAGKLQILFAGPVQNGCTIFPVAAGDDLGHNRQGHLLGSFGPDVQPDRSMDTAQLLVGQPLLLEALIALLASLAAADGSDVADLARENHLKGWLIELGVVGQNGDRR